MVDPYRREAWRAEAQAWRAESRGGVPESTDQGFSRIQGNLFGFYGIKIVFGVWILPSRVVDPRKKVPDLNCEVQDPLLEVVDLE